MINFFKKLFMNMSDKEITTSDTVVQEKSDDNLKYQWVKGDKVGQVETFEKDIVDDKNINWVYFKSGNRINKNVIHEYMLFLEDGIELPIEEIEQTVVNSSDTQIKPVTKSPLRQLLEKQSESSKESVSVNLKLNIPKTEVYSILEDSFGSDVKDEIVNIIIDDLGTSKLKELIKESILTFYNT